MYKNRIIIGVDEKKKNTGDEKEFGTFLWCAFLGGRILDEKENLEVGDTECVGNQNLP